MRVLTLGNMYPPHHQGGYELVWAAVVAGLRAAGHDVRVLTTTHREPSAAGVPDDPAVRRELPWYWHEHAFPRRAPREVLALERRAHAVLADELAAHPADVVACFSMGGLPLSLLGAPAVLARPVCAVVHDEWPGYGPLVDPWTRLHRRLGRLSGPVARLTGLPPGPDLGHVSRWSCNSAYVRDRAIAAGAPLDRAVASVDPPGIDPARFPAAPAPAGWSGRLLTVGRLVPEKGAEHAVRALAALPGHRLDLVGSGEDEHVAALTAVAAEAGVAERVALRGPLGGADLTAAYAAADAVVFPVVWAEPFGLVPLEAMAVGRPVVATATGGAAEFLRHEENALVVPPADPSAIAAAVRRLADDAALRERLRAAGTRTAAQYTEKAFVGAVVAAIEECGDRRGAMP